MKYYRTYNTVVVIFLIMLASFLWFFMLRPDSTEAGTAGGVLAPQKVAAGQLSTDNTRLSGANYAKIDSVKGESLSTNTPNNLSWDITGRLLSIQDNSENSGNSANLASAANSDADSPTVETESSFSVSSSAPISSGGSSSAASAGSASSSGGGGAGSSSSDNSSAANNNSTPDNSTPTSGSGGSVDPFSNITVTVLPSVQRLLQDDISAPGTAAAQLFCAKNETESFQVIVTNKSYYTLPDIELYVSDWQGPAGVNKPTVTLYREHYVKIDKPSYGLISKTGMYPDALIPFEDPYTDKSITRGMYLADHASVKSKNNQGYWADVRVDSDVSAGTYTCSILVTSSDRQVAEIPVMLTVWDFALPKQRQFITWYYGFYDIHQYYGLSRASGSYYDTLMEYHRDMAYEHGIYPAFQLGGADYNTKNGTVTFSPLYHSNMRRFIGKYGIGILTIPPSWLVEDYAGACPLPSGTTTPTATAAKKTLESYNKLSKAHPEYGQYVVYLDEPWRDNRPIAASIIKDIMNTIPDMKIKMMLTGEEYAFDILDSAGNRCADLWVCYGQNIIDNHVRAPRSYRSLEDLTSSFLNDSNKSVWANLSSYTDENLLAYRDFAWYGYTLGMTGGFGWQLTMPSTDAIGDAWTQANSYINPGAPTRVYNGTGFHIYPGNSDQVGISGIGGPVASMRLKVWRRACQDFEYFKILEDLTNKATVDAIVSNVVRGYNTYADPADYEAARKEIAELILEYQP